MSSTDSMDLRAPPARFWRITVLLAALACLGLTMCVRSEKRAPAKPATTNQQAAPPQQQTQAPQPPPAKPEYFNATKAPGGMYR